MVVVGGTGGRKEMMPDVSKQILFRIFCSCFINSLSCVHIYICSVGCVYVYRQEISNFCLWSLEKMKWRRRKESERSALSVRPWPCVCSRGGFRVKVLKGEQDAKSHRWVWRVRNDANEALKRGTRAGRVRVCSLCARGTNALSHPHTHLLPCTLHSAPALFSSRSS